MSASAARTLAALCAAGLTGCANPPPPIGPWSSLDFVEPDKPERLAQWKEARENSCLPSAQEVFAPIPPGVEVLDVDWEKKPPNCHRAVTAGHARLELLLFTNAPSEDVVRWYAERLDNLQRYETPADAGEWWAPERKPWDRSWERLKRFRSVTVAPQKPLPWSGKVPYRTLINIYDPGP